MAWNTLPTFANSTVYDAADLNEIIANINFLSTGRIKALNWGDDAGNITTTSTTFTAMGAPFTTTQTFQGGLCLLVTNAMFEVSVSSQPFVQIRVDGTAIGPSTNGHPITRSTFDHRGGSIMRWFTIGSGSHTVALYWRTTAGTLTCLNTSGHKPFFYIREISWTP